MNTPELLSGPWLWVGLLLIALTTHVSRCSFILAGNRVQLPAALQRALCYAPAATLAALVIPDVAQVHGQLNFTNAKLLAAIVVFAVALRWKNPWLPFAAGMGALWACQPILGI